MKHLFRDKISPVLDELFSVEPSKLITIKTVGIGESDIQERLENLNLPQGVQLGFRTGMDENQTKLLFSPGYPEPEIKSITNDVAKRIGDPVFAISGFSEKDPGLVDVIGEMLNKRRQKLAVVESFSHGLLSAKCVGQIFLEESIYGKKLERLFSRLGLNYRLEEEFEAAVKLAKAIKFQTRADIALVQLYQGMRNDALSLEVIGDNDQSLTLYNVLAAEDNLVTQSLQIGGTMKRKQNQAALSALDFLRRHLQNKI